MEILIWTLFLALIISIVVLIRNAMDAGVPMPRRRLTPRQERRRLRARRRADLRTAAMLRTDDNRHHISIVSSNN